MTEEQLKDTLIQLKNEEIDWDQVNVDTVVDAMLRYTQTTDIELKEGYLEPLLSEIIQEKYISEASMEALAKRCIGGDYLYLEIGDLDTRNKMTRSFAMMTLELLLKKDVEDVFLSNQLYDEIRKEIVLYLDLEQDYRSYSEEMGWVNSVMYGIDAIHAMVKNPRLHHKYHTELFQTLLNKMFTFKVIYQYDEEEHAIDVIESLMNSNFDEKKLIDFFARVPDFLAQQKGKLDTQQYWNLYKNCKSLVRGMYIRMEIDEEYPLLLTEVKKCLITL